MSRAGQGSAPSNTISGVGRLGEGVSINSSSHGTFLAAERDPERALDFLSPAEVPECHCPQAGLGQEQGVGQSSCLLGWGTLRGNKPLDLSLQHHKHLCKGKMKGFFLGRGKSWPLWGTLEGGCLFILLKEGFPRQNKCFDGARPGYYAAISLLLI